MSNTMESCPVSPLLIQQNSKCLSSNTLPLTDIELKPQSVNIGSGNYHSFDKRQSQFLDNQAPILLGQEKLIDPNLVQFHVLGGKTDAHNYMAGPGIDYQNNLDMLDANNGASDVSPSLSAFDVVPSAKNSGKGSRPDLNIEKHENNRLRLLQVKQSEKDRQTPQKVHDLQVVLDRDADQLDKPQLGHEILETEVLERFGIKHKKHMKRVQSQQRSKRLNQCQHQLQTRRTTTPYDLSTLLDTKNNTMQMSKRLSQSSQPLELLNSTKPLKVRGISELQSCLEPRSMENSARHVLDLNSQVGNLEMTMNTQQVTASQKQRSQNLSRQRGVKSAVQIQVQIQAKNREVMGQHQLRQEQYRRKSKISHAKHTQALDSDVQLLRIDNRSANRRVIASAVKAKTSLKIREEPQSTEQSFDCTLSQVNYILSHGGQSLCNTRPTKMFAQLNELSNTVQFTRNDKQVQDNQKQYNSSNPTEHQIEQVCAPQRQDFIVKTFTPSVETKVQRQARRLKNSSSLYNPRPNILFQKPKRGSSAIGHGIKDQQINQQSALSSTRILVDSLNEKIRLVPQDLEYGLSTNKKQISSLFVSEGVENETIMNDIPIVLEAYGDKPVKLECELPSTIGSDFILKDALQSITLKESEARFNATEFMESNLMSHEDENSRPQVIKSEHQNHIKQRNQFKFRVHRQNSAESPRLIDAQNSLPDQLGDIDLIDDDLELEPSSSMKRTMTANIRWQTQKSTERIGYIKNDLASSSQAILKKMRPQGTQRQAEKVLSHKSHSNVRKHSAVQQRKMRTRIEAARKFNKDFNEPISIRRTFPLQQANNYDETCHDSSFKDLSSNMALSLRSSCQGHSKAKQNRQDKIAKNKTHSLIVSAKNSFGLRSAINHTVTADLSMTALKPPSLPLGALQDITSRGLATTKPIKEMPQNDNLTAASSKSDIRIHNNAMHKADKCQCTKSMIAMGHERQSSAGMDIESQSNPYNMTIAECEAIKVKNRSLISQFQTSQRSSIKQRRTSFQEEPRSFTTQINSWNIKQDETLLEPCVINKVPQVDTDAPPSLADNNSPGGQKDKSTEILEVKIADIHSASVQELEQSLNQNPRGVDSLNSVTNEGEGNSPITRPVQYGQVNLGSRRTNDFQTAKLSSSCRSNAGEATVTTMYQLEFKERPASSKQGTNITVLDSAALQVQRNPKTRIISQVGTTRISDNRYSILRQQDDQMQVEPIDSGMMTNSADTVDMKKSKKRDVSLHEGAHCTQEISSAADKFSSIKEGSKRSQGVQVLDDIHNQSSGSIIVDGSLPCSQDGRVSADQILSMNEHEINQLKFSDVCLCQQVLYGTLSDLQDQLSQAAVQRKSLLAHIKEPVDSKSIEREVHSIKRQIYTTNYEGNARNRLPDNNADTPFSFEQQEMRKKIRIQSGQRKSNAGIANHKRSNLRVKLIEESSCVDKRQEEISNYFKYKNRQVKTKQRQESFNQKKAILEQCSLEEVLIMGKIKVLVDAQQVLAKKARICSSNTVQELVLIDRSNERTENNSVIEYHQPRQQVVGLGRLQIDCDIDTKHQPTAQRVTSRQSLHKLQNKSGDTSAAQTLIQAASEKLNFINRQRQTRPTSNVRPKSSRKINLIMGLAGAGNSDQFARSGFSSSLSNVRHHSLAVGSDLNKDLGLIGGYRDSIQQHQTVGLAKTTMEENEMGTIGLKSFLLLNESQRQKKKPVNSTTINLYLKKVSSDHNLVKSIEQNQRIPTNQLLLSEIQQKDQPLQQDSKDGFAQEFTFETQEKSPVDKFNLIYRSSKPNGTVSSQAFVLVKTKSLSGSRKKLRASSSQSSVHSSALHPLRQRSSKSGGNYVMINDM